MKISKEEQALLEDGTKQKTVEFTITINGTGNDAEEAWQDALESLMMDPGQMDEEDITSVEEVEED